MFKLNDEVMVRSGKFSGHIGTVIGLQDIKPPYIYLVNIIDENGTVYPNVHHEDELELILSNEKFKVGDRVKNYRGWIGTIVALQTHTCPYTVQWDGGSMINYTESELELLPSQPLTVKELEQEQQTTVSELQMLLETHNLKLTMYGGYCMIELRNGPISCHGEDVEEVLKRMLDRLKKEDEKEL